MTENFLKKKEGLKNSTLSKVAFGLAIVSVVSLIIIVADYLDLILGLSLANNDPSYYLVLSWQGAFVLGIISLFQKKYKKTLAIIAVIYGFICLVFALYAVLTFF